ncbi:hypothetical protein Tco_0929347 [Tanacetum coccineum]
MNANECVSKGWALKFSILSPTFKVSDFQARVHYELQFERKQKIKKATGKFLAGSRKLSSSRLIGDGLLWVTQVFKPILLDDLLQANEVKKLLVDEAFEVRK